MTENETLDLHSGINIEIVVAIFLGILLYTVSLTDIYIFPAITVTGLTFPFLCCSRLARILFFVSSGVIILRVATTT